MTSSVPSSCSPSSCSASREHDSAVMSTPPRMISVIIPVRNACEWLDQQLSALASQRYAGPWEVLVADNGSTDTSRETVVQWTQRLPNLRLIDASRRPGANHARNVAAAAARGDLLAFCDADDRADPGWLAALAAAAAPHVLLGGQLAVGELNPAPLLWRASPTRDGLPWSWKFLPYSFSANLALPTAVFDALGGWDERFVGGGEDVEFCWRAQLAGYGLRYVPEAVMHYRFRGGLRHLARQSYRYGLHDPLLYRLYREHGMRRQLLRATGRWAWILLHAGDLARGAGPQGRWIRKAASSAGRLHGSVRSGTFLP